MRHVIRRIAVVAGAVAVVLGSAVGFGALGASAQAGPAASGQQCRNGPVTAPAPCQIPPTGSNGWVRGNAGRTNAHWAEGDFISYRIILTGLTAGVHNLVFSYQTVNSSKHAIDYVGSYDATETTGPPTPLHANRNNPCVDQLGSTTGSGCTAVPTPPHPASRFPVPTADLAGQRTACGASGLPTTPTQVPGHFSLFAPDAAAARITGATYLSQNVLTASGTCTTTMRVDFRDATPPAGGWTMILAFGGRIASALDWGDGNSAGAISGSPYHMSTLSLDGTTQGRQDLALSTDAVAAPPTPITTQVSSTQITPGSKLTDTATLTGTSAAPPRGGPPTGTVQFRLCSNTTTGCPQGTGRNIGSPVGLAPVDTTNNSSASKSFGSRLAPGHYCVGVAYMNDDLSFYSPFYEGGPTNECFTVAAPTVVAGYADGFRMIDGDHPDPWQGSPHVIFVGCNFRSPTTCATGTLGPIYDAGALMITNTTSQEITVTNATVTAGTCHYNPWPGLNKDVPVGDSLILTQTGAPPPCPGTSGTQPQNFDTSQLNHAAGTVKCTVNNDLHPHFHVRVDGGHPLTYRDTQQILNTGGVDPGARECGAHNETHDWATTPMKLVTP